MVTEYGMSSKLGAVKYGTSDSEPFLGRDYGHTRDYSEDIAADIDTEVRDLIEAAHDEAWEILVQYRDALDEMVLELVEKETLSKDDLERILAPVRKRPPHNTFTGFGKRTPSDRPPVDIPLSARSNGRSDTTNGQAPPVPQTTPGYGQPGYGQPGYGQPGDYGQPATASRARAMGSPARASRVLAHTGVPAPVTAVRQPPVTVSPARATEERPDQATASRRIRPRRGTARQPEPAGQPVSTARWQPPRAASRPGRWDSGLSVTLRRGSR